MDTREFLTPVGIQIERASADIKLESVSHATIVVTIGLVYFAALLSFLLAVIPMALRSRS
jgi:hypothetical protein